MRRLGIGGYQQLCREYGYFTSGSCQQYEVVTCYAMDLTYEDARKCTYDFERVVYMTWICSDTDTFTPRDIRSVLYNRVINL